MVICFSFSVPLQRWLRGFRSVRSPRYSFMYTLHAGSRCISLGSIATFSFRVSGFSSGNFSNFDARPFSDCWLLGHRSSLPGPAHTFAQVAEVEHSRRVSGPLRLHRSSTCKGIPPFFFFFEKKKVGRPCDPGVSFGTISVTHFSVRHLSANLKWTEKRKACLILTFSVQISCGLRLKNFA